MWEKINKVRAAVIASMIIIISSFALAFVAAKWGLPDSATIFINKVTDIALVGAIAWLLNNRSNKQAE